MRPINLSIYCSLAIVNLFHLDDTALVVCGGKYGRREYSRRDILLDAKKAIRYMKTRIALNPGDKIAIIASNCYEGIVFNIAANAIGVGTAFLNSADTAESLAKSVLFYEAKFVFTDRADWEDIAKCTYPQPIAYCHVDSISRLWNFSEISDLSGAVWPKILGSVFSKRELLFLQTSGSSGKSKSLPFTNRNFMAALDYCSRSTGIKIRDEVYHTCLCTMPYRLPYGWSMIFANLVGGQVVYLANADTIIDDMRSLVATKADQIDVIYGTPAILRNLIDNLPYNFSLEGLKVFFSGGFSLPESWHYEGLEFFMNHGADQDVQICNDYGFGEGLCIGTCSKDLPYRGRQSLGKFFVGPEWHIVDEGLNPVPPGTMGEIIVHSASNCASYYHNPRETARHFITWHGKPVFRTGDFASVDADGIVTYMDRARKFYLPIGAPEKVYCSSIEQVIERLRFVRQCVVVSGDGIHGCAYVVTDKEEIYARDWTDEKARTEIAKYLEHKLLKYQLPSKIVFMDELPMLSSGKVDLKSLQNLNLSV